MACSTRCREYRRRVCRLNLFLSLSLFADVPGCGGAALALACTVSLSPDWTKAMLTTVMMACVSDLGAGFDEFKYARPFCQPQREEVLGVLVHCRIFQSTAVSHQPPKRRRQDVPQQTGRVAGLGRDLAIAHRRRSHPPKRRVEGLKWCIQYEARAWAIVSDGGIVDGWFHLGGTCEHPRITLAISPFSALWPSIRSRAAAPLRLLMRGPRRRTEV